jgi:HEAT repeat protein
LFRGGTVKERRRSHRAGGGIGAAGDGGRPYRARSLQKFASLVLENGEESLRKAAVLLLGMVDGPEARKRLERALEDESPAVREAAARVLAERGGTESLPLLRKLLRDPEESVRDACLESVAGVEGREADEFLEKCLESADWRTREKAAGFLMRRGWKPQKNRAGACYHIALRDREACAGMGKAAVEPLESFLRWAEKEEDVCFACSALGGIAREEAVDALLRALKDRRPAVRCAAAEALGGTGRRKAVESLLDCLEDENEEVRRAARRSLVALGPCAVTPVVEALRWGEEKFLRELSLLLVDMSRSEETVPLLNQAIIVSLKDGDSGRRTRIVEVLTEVGNEWAARLLVEAFVFYHVRTAAVEALVRLGGAAFHPLVQALRHKHPFVRKAACEALAKLGDPRAAEPLLSALRDRDFWVREAAKAALQELAARREHAPRPSPGSEKTVSVVPFPVHRSSPRAGETGETGKGPYGEAFHSGDSPFPA